MKESFSLCDHWGLFAIKTNNEPIGTFFVFPPLSDYSQICVVVTNKYRSQNLGSIASELLFRQLLPLVNSSYEYFIPKENSIFYTTKLLRGFISYVAGSNYGSLILHARLNARVLDYVLNPNQVGIYQITFAIPSLEGVNISDEKREKLQQLENIILLLSHRNTREEAKNIAKYL